MYLSPSQKLIFDLSTTLYNLWSFVMSLDFTEYGNFIDAIPIKFLLFYYFVLAVHCTCIVQMMMQLQE